MEVAPDPRRLWRAGDDWAWCRGVYTHHQRVAIHQREPFEDGDSRATVVATASDGDDLAGAPDVPANPSSRRNGITVDLYCELCGGWFALRIAQHKGQTIIDVMKTRDGEGTTNRPTAGPAAPAARRATRPLRER